MMMSFKLTNGHLIACYLPGVLLHLMHEEHMDEPALSDLLYNRCGLLGVSGISNDMRVIKQHAQDGNERCQLAMAWMLLLRLVAPPRSRRWAWYPVPQ